MRERILGGLAWALIAIGVSIADSECLLVPVLAVLAGSILLRKVFL